MVDKPPVISVQTLHCDLRRDIYIACLAAKAPCYEPLTTGTYPLVSHIVFDIRHLTTPTRFTRRHYIFHLEKYLHVCIMEPILDDVAELVGGRGGATVTRRASPRTGVDEDPVVQPPQDIPRDPRGRKPYGDTKYTSEAIRARHRAHYRAHGRPYTYKKKEKFQCAFVNKKDKRCERTSFQAYCCEHRRWLDIPNANKPPPVSLNVNNIDLSPPTPMDRDEFLKMWLGGLQTI